MAKALLSFLFLFPIIQCSFSQIPTKLEKMNSLERQEIAFESIQAIYSGVLVVRLSSNARRTAVLNKQINDPYSSAEQMAMYKKMLSKSEAETRENNELLMDSFADNYNFSEVFFVYDTSIHYLTEGHQKGFFLGQDLEIDSTINLAGRPYRLARYGSPLASSMKEMLGIVVMTKEYEDLTDPFPYKSIGFRSAIVNSEKRKPRLQRHFNSIVSTLNNRFHLFYKEYKKQIDSSN